MPQLQLISRCCRGKVRKFGKRRRQCGTCRKTWSVRQKKRGRKRLKVNRQMVIRYLERKQGFVRHGIDSTRRRLRASLSAFVSHACWEYPDPKVLLIAVVDGMWHSVEHQPCVTYLVLLRPVGSSLAWIMPPVVIAGKESGVGWQIALESIPDEQRNRIKAVVCDGEPHLTHHLKMHYGWHIQRCHFHIIASIKNYVTAGLLSRNRTFGNTVLEAVYSALTTPHENELEDLLTRIRLCIKMAKNKKLRSRLRGFVRDIDDFRTYLHYPDLNLPTTSNAAESLVQCIRNLLYRARGFKTIPSFIQWVTAVCLHKKTIVCNGKNQQNKRL